MGKRENHRRDLEKLFDSFFESGDAKGLTDYITANSNLPGRRANLELAEAFGDGVSVRAEKAPDKMWAFCVELTRITAHEAPVNSPEEFIPFCGALGVGVIGSVSPRHFESALRVLRLLANDIRWRMREATCFGVQRLLAKDSQSTLTALEGWVASGDMLEMRAAAATVADPNLLRVRRTAIRALRLHGKILEQLLKVQDRRSNAFKTLRKALGYTLSVVVQATPQEGFQLMAQLADWQDRDVIWIVNQNLRKNRLLKNYPEQVKTIKMQLECR